MVLKLFGAVAHSLLPSTYYVHVIVAIVVVVVMHAVAQGRATNRERDLNARIVLVTVRIHFVFNPVPLMRYRAGSPPSG